MSSVLNCTGYEQMDSTIVHSAGCYVTNKQGKRYLDAESGVWCTILGHNHHEINRAMIEQLSEITHVGYRYSTDIVENAGDLLLEVSKIKTGKCVFLSSGSEAVEFGIRVAKKIAEKQICLCLDNHYLAAYGQGYEKDGKNWISLDWTKYTDGQELSSILKNIPFETIGVFILEPGNASGLVKLPPKELITAIVNQVRVNQGLIVVDEVTTGVGRAGKWFGYENYDIIPDIVACGKSLGNGYPVSAVIMNESVASRIAASGFVYAQSHQNDPLGCAVAKEVLTVIKKENLIEKSNILGEYLQQQLKELMQKYKFIREVRGSGLMQAIELKHEVGQKVLLEIHRELFQAGFIIGVKPVFYTLRFYPPLIVEKEMIDALINALDVAFESLL